MFVVLLCHSVIPFDLLKEMCLSITLQIYMHTYIDDHTSNCLTSYSSFFWIRGVFYSLDSTSTWSWVDKPTSDLHTCPCLCSQPKHVAAVLNLLISGWHIDIMRLMEGDTGLVQEAALKCEPVILPVLILNHRGDLDWDLVFNSTASASCSNAARKRSTLPFRLWA